MKYEYKLVTFLSTGNHQFSSLRNFMPMIILTKKWGIPYISNANAHWVFKHRRLSPLTKMSDYFKMK